MVFTNDGLQFCGGKLPWFIQFMRAHEDWVSVMYILHTLGKVLPLNEGPKSLFLIFSCHNILFFSYQIPLPCSLFCEHHTLTLTFPPHPRYKSVINLVNNFSGPLLLIRRYVPSKTSTKLNKAIMPRSIIRCMQTITNTHLETLNLHTPT